MRFTGFIVGLSHLLLCIAATLLLLNLYSSSSVCQLRVSAGFESYRIFVFSVFNVISFVVLVRGYRPSSDEFEASVPFVFTLYDDYGDDHKDKHYDDYFYDEDDDDDQSAYHGSDGYDEEDDDDYGSDDEIGWNDDDDYDNNEQDYDLERRVEDFIAKVIAGWKEELLNGY